MARRRFPGAPASLDALCRRFAIDLTARDKHGAGIDCALLAEVYIELLGGRQPGLDFAATTIDDMIGEIVIPQVSAAAAPACPSLDELAAHQAMLVAIKTPAGRDAGRLIRRGRRRAAAASPAGVAAVRRCGATTRRNRSG